MKRVWGCVFAPLLPPRSSQRLPLMAARPLHGDVTGTMSTHCAVYPSASSHFWLTSLTSIFPARRVGASALMPISPGRQSSGLSHWRREDGRSWRRRSQVANLNHNICLTDGGYNELRSIKRGMSDDGSVRCSRPTLRRLLHAYLCVGSRWRGRPPLLIATAR
jgi:hypothetical protein